MRWGWGGGRNAAVATLALAGLTGCLIAEYSTPAVVASMVESTRARQASLPAFSARRIYQLDYQGWSHQTASMTVRVEYSGHGPKRLILISESGSELLLRRGMEPLLQAERKDAALTASEGSALVPRNYTFRMLADPPDSYLLSAQPRPDADRRRFLFRGRIWVNGSDYGVERVEGRSARSPSFWVRDTQFEYRAQRLGGYWLMASEHSVSRLRWFGRAVLDIRVENFHWLP